MKTSTGHCNGYDHLQDKDFASVNTNANSENYSYSSNGGIEGNNGSFYFGNFLPSSHSARLRLLRNVVGPAHYPCIFYEVPRRLLLILQDIAAVLPRRRVFVTHELTKLNESLHSDRV